MAYSSPTKSPNTAQFAAILGRLEEPLAGAAETLNKSSESGSSGEPSVFRGAAAVTTEIPNSGLVSLAGKEFGQNVRDKHLWRLLCRHATPWHVSMTRTLRLSQFFAFLPPENGPAQGQVPVSYTHLRAHETEADL
eukprot:459311-Rhodomonas_salina.2